MPADSRLSIVILTTLNLTLQNFNGFNDFYQHQCNDTQLMVYYQWHLITCLQNLIKRKLIPLDAHVLSREHHVFKSVKYQVCKYQVCIFNTSFFYHFLPWSNILMNINVYSNI